MALTTKTLLYVGTQGDKNAGVVTTDKGYLGGTTEELGYTIDDAHAQPSDEYVEVFAGTQGEVNLGVVSPNWNHAGGSTKSIGYLSKQPIERGSKIYVGVGPHQNGEATNNTMHKGESTKFLGYALGPGRRPPV